jgi:hypothetical protein
MRANIIPVLFGCALGIALAFGAVYAAYRSDFVPAIVMVVCQIAAFGTFIYLLLSKRSSARGSLDS